MSNELTLTHLRVTKHWKSGALQFHAWRNATDTHIGAPRDVARPLVYDSDESSEPKAYDTFEAALAVCVAFEFEGEEDSRWDYVTGAWEYVAPPAPTAADIAKAYARYRTMSWTKDTDECEWDCGTLLDATHFAEGRYGHYCGDACKAKGESSATDDSRAERQQLGFTALD